MFNKENLHHAYCIEGEKGAVYQKLCVFLEDELKIKTKGNPDFSYLDFETLTIDEGRILKDRQQKKSFTGGRKIFVVATNFITREAQNSLLKIFEEPTEGTHFFLILPSSRVLIPTLRSRLEITQLGGKASKLGEEDLNRKKIKKFIESSKSERLIFLKDIIESKDKQEAIVFLDEIEMYLAGETDFQKIGKGRTSVFNEIIKAKDYLGDRGSSVKMILEHISLILDKEV